MRKKYFTDFSMNMVKLQKEKVTTVFFEFSVSMSVFSVNY